MLGAYGNEADDILCALSLTLSYLKAESQNILGGFSPLGVSWQGTRSLIRSTQCNPQILSLMRHGLYYPV